jgi:cytoskeleton protein RodZ
VNLFHRIKSPFSEPAEEEALAPEWPVHSVGEMLRERREALALDLETAGAALRIKPIYLVALEQGRAQDLPGPTYVVGFIRAYAHYLGFDGGWMLDRYKAETAEVGLRPDLSLPVPLSDRSLPGGPILLVAVILALCGYGTWYYLSTSERARPERVAAVPAELQREAKSPSPPAAAKSAMPDAAAKAAAIASPVAAKATAASGADGLGVAGNAQLTSGLAAADTNAPAQPDARGDVTGVPSAATPSTATETPTSAAAAPPAGPVLPAISPSAAALANDGTAKPDEKIDIRALADCWIQVRSADQTVVFSRVLKAGETYRVPRSGLVMRVGSAGALAIMVDGKPAPSLGPVGTLRRDVVLDPEALLAGTAVHG